ncbi:type III secretion system translocon subunit SctE [Telmatospirillum sp. J64-1]|uniref:type III secretion system translocon subunit SctE n=1 Tax=Telmatospirillum sp. J64-1 TaxID=2502183 RepID=UPI00115E8812|nr:type III secretion system translocon subunit SctE [Telmatospirillum sp. J64-1]
MSVDGLGRSGVLPTQTPTTTGTEAAGPNLQQLVQKVVGDLSKVAMPKDSKGTSAPPGAPRLEAPKMSFSADDAVLILGSLQNKLNESQLKTAKEGIQMDAKKKDELHQEAMKKLEEAAKKLAEASKSSFFGKIFGFISKIATLVASAVAVAAAAALTAATGGAAAPLLVVACIGMSIAIVDTVATIANEISQALGGPDLTINGLITAAVTEIAKAFGADEEKAKEIAGWTAMAIQVAVAVAMAVASIAATVATGGAAAGSMVQSFATTANVISGIVQGGLAAAQGGISINTAVKEKQATNAQADKLDIQKLMLKVQQQMEEEADRVRELVQQLDEGMQRVSSIVAAGGETRMQISRNMI